MLIIILIFYCHTLCPAELRYIMAYYGSALMGLFRWNDTEKKLLSTTGDSSLVKKHSQKQAFTNPSSERPISLRTFYLPHHKKHKLPSLPTVLFLHGLGGQLNQFEYLFDYCSHFAAVLSLDLPGHGQSDYCTDWETYSQHNLLRLISQVINSHCSTNNNGVEDEIVIVSHSMGTTLAAKLASSEKYLGPRRCKGIIAICPPGGELDKGMERTKTILSYSPTLLFDFFRSLDRQGGLNSKSVDRLVHSRDEDVREKQLRWNLQVNSAAWIRSAYNFTPATESDWQNISCPLYLIGAEQDKVTPSDKNIARILSYFSGPHNPSSSDILVESTVVPDSGHSIMIEKPQVVCGLIGDFITRKVDSKLSLAWQLGFLASKKDKWSLKNEDKWKSVQPVGDRVEGSPFRGVKTLRQDDPVHNPANVEATYPDICHIIDISRETPPYEPLTFHRIKYHKFPTVSKIPPTESEVDKFIELIDQCLQESSDHADPVIAVHCHYGYNRTGFFIACYMVQKLKFSVRDALERFAVSRPPGIKHIHFRDELYVRYDL